MVKQTFRYPCLDKYPDGQQFMTNNDLMNLSQIELKQQGLKGKLSATKQYKKLKAAFKVSSLWNPQTHPIIKINFMDGTDKQKNFVKKMVNESLAPLTSKLTYDFTSPQLESHIRISFALPGQAWSMIGSEALQVDKTQPTINLGWLDDDVQFSNEGTKNTGQVVLHEFGHAMGMIHEHQSPFGNPIKWNKEVIYEELQRTNGWNKQMVDHNMFKKYGDDELCNKAKELPIGSGERRIELENFCQGELVNGSQYDVTSIMHYFYPQTWISQGPAEIPVNIKYSALDEEWLRKYYGEPKKEVITAVLKKVETDVVEGFNSFMHQAPEMCACKLVMGVFVVVAIIHLIQNRIR